MKTLSEHSETAIDSPYVEPILLLTIALSGLTLYFCDRAFGEKGSEYIFDGKFYEPLVISWGSLETGRIDPVSHESEHGKIDIVIDNNVPVGGRDFFTALFSDYEPHYASVEINLIFKGAGAGDEIPLFKGQIEDVVNMLSDQVTLTCTGYELSINNRFEHTIVNTDDWPYADPDDLGKMLPQVYGRAKKVPFRALDAGALTTLVFDISASSTSIYLTDTSKFLSSGTVQIDTEQINYTDKTSTRIYGCTRGVNGTDAAVHDAGVHVAQVKTRYVYAIGHPVRYIRRVYVDNIRQQGNYTAYTGQPGSELPGYEGMAVIAFNTLPIVQKQINIDIDDNIDVDDVINVNDTIGVNQGNHTHDQTQATIVWEFEVPSVISGTITNRYNICDGNFESNTGFNAINSQLRVEKGFYQEYSGPPTHVRICMRTANLGPGVTMRFTFAGRTLNISTDSTLAKTSWAAVSSSYNTWAEINAAEGRIRQLYSSNLSGVSEVWAEFRYTPDLGTNPATGVAKTGLAFKSGTVFKIGTVELVGNSSADTVIGQIVSADIDGWRADSSGDYGPTNSLIQRPQYILKHILVERCGLTVDNIDLDSYAASGSSYVVFSITEAIVILQKPNVRNLINRIAFQANSLEFWDAGKHYLKYIYNAPVDKTLDGNRIDLNQIYLKYTDRAYILNTFSARYARDWSGYEDSVEADRAIVITSDVASIIKYGPLEGDQYSFPYITRESQASLVLDWIMDDLKDVRLIIELAGGYYLTDIEKGDVLSFEFEPNSPLEQACLGLVTTSNRFRVLDKIYRPDAAIQIEIIKM